MVSFVRQRDQRLTWVAATAALALMGGSNPAFSHVALETNRAKIAPNDVVDWSRLGPPGAEASTPLRLRSKRGVGVTVSQPASANGSSFKRLGPNSEPYGFALHGIDLRSKVPGRNAAWKGNVAPSNAMLWASDNAGPIDITFDQPVFGAGFHFRDRDFSRSFQSRVTCYDIHGRPMKLFDKGNRQIRMSWTRTTSADGSSLIYMGVRSCCACIKRVRIEASPPYREPEQPQPPLGTIPPRITPVVDTPPVTELPVESLPTPPLVATAPPSAFIPAPAFAPATAAAAGAPFPWIIPLIAGGAALLQSDNDTDVPPPGVPPPVNPPPINPPDVPVVPPPPPPPPIPEPSALTLMVPGLLALSAMRRRKNRGNREE